MNIFVSKYVLCAYYFRNLHCLIFTDISLTALPPPPWLGPCCWWVSAWACWPPLLLCPTPCRFSKSVQASKTSRNPYTASSAVTLSLNWQTSQRSRSWALHASSGTISTATVGEWGWPRQRGSDPEEDHLFCNSHMYTGIRSNSMGRIQNIQPKEIYVLWYQAVFHVIFLSYIVFLRSSANHPCGGNQGERHVCRGIL